MMGKAEIIQAQREIIQGYYNRIGLTPSITVEDIMQMLEHDLQYIREETLVLDAENIINTPKELHEVSMVQCDLCNHTWVAVRPQGLTELQCPSCNNLTTFENIETK